MGRTSIFDLLEYSDRINRNYQVNTEHKPLKPTPPVSQYEKTKAEVYATGNKWAIENFHATHD